MCAIHSIADVITFLKRYAMSSVPKASGASSEESNFASSGGLCPLPLFGRPTNSQEQGEKADQECVNIVLHGFYFYYLFYFMGGIIIRLKLLYNITKSLLRVQTLHPQFQCGKPPNQVDEE